MAPLLCSSALGLVPLSAVHHLEEALRAAHKVLGSSFAPPHLSVPLHLLRAQDLLYFARLSAALVRVVSNPFLGLQDAAMFLPGFSEMATSACYWLQTWADTWSLSETMLSTMMIEPHEEPLDLQEHLDALHFQLTTFLPGLCSMPLVLRGPLWHRRPHCSVLAPTPLLTILGLRRPIGNLWCSSASLSSVSLLPSSSKNPG